MTDSTNMDIYEASASDCIATQPPLLSSRKPQHRKLHSRTSPYYKRRKASYQKRRTKRIRDSEYPELSSSDELDPPSLLTQAGFPNPRFLPYMPRPSDIVPAIEDGSASDAGFDPQAREVHKRRVEATRILLASIGPRGILIPVPHWKRNRSGLSKYTTFMNPPQEDKNLPDLRVPPPLLSSFYRGSLLAVHRVGRPKQRPKQENRASSSPEASAFECEYLGSSSRSDFEVSEPRMLVKSEPQEIVADDNNAASPVHGQKMDSVKEPSPFSKAAFLEELERIAGGSSDGVSDADMEQIRQSGIPDRNTSSEGESEGELKVPAKPKGQAESEAKNSADAVQEILKPEKKSEIDLFRDLLSLNPELLSEEQKPVDKEAHVVKVVEMEEQVIEEEEESDSNLTEFQNEKRLSLMFSHNTAKRPRSTAKDMTAKYLNPPKRRKCGVSFGGGDGATNNGASESRMNLKFTMKLMNKMGFTGRLGKKEDGRKDPVVPTRRSFRSGLGSRLAQTPARIGDQSLLPTKFKAKSAENGIPAACSGTSVATGDDEIRPNRVVSSNPNNSPAEGGDVYTRRRKRSVNTSERQPHYDRHSSTKGIQCSTTKEEVQNRQLDHADTCETEEEDIGVDNGRRAILIDIDALIKDSSKRRFDATEKMLFDASLTVNVKKLLAKEPRDLCEADLLRKVLGHANVKPHDMDEFKEKLDEAFESLPPPELDAELVDMLRQYSKDVHFGIFHRGSRRRLQYDLKETGLTNSFLQEVCVIVKHEEKWPYIDTWQDLTCRVGVGPRQCLYILNETRVARCMHEWRPSTGATAGACLGAQTAVWEKVEEGVKLCIRSPMQEERVMKINNSSAHSDRIKVFDGLLKSRMPVLKRRRVLAQYEDDLLWYSAVVQYEGAKEGKSWIKFNKFENTEWVDNEDLVPLCRRDFRKMKKMDFPGLIDSDASVL